MRCVNLFCYDMRGCLYYIGVISHRTVLDDDLIAIAENCAMLEQLDILGNSNVTKKSAERLVLFCKSSSYTFAWKVKHF